MRIKGSREKIVVSTHNDRKAKASIEFLLRQALLIFQVK